MSSISGRPSLPTGRQQFAEEPGDRVFVMPRIYQAESDQDRAHVRELYLEYLEWANSRIAEEFGFSFDIQSMIEQDMLLL